MRLWTAATCVALFAGSLLSAEEADSRNSGTRPAVRGAARSNNDAELLKGATSHVYKSVNGTELKLYVFQPEGHQATDRRPAIVFFFGGGWKNGSPTQFASQSRYLASRGMVAIVADYRVKSRNDSTVEQSVADAKSAIRWVRSHSGELGIDANRIAAGGGSAGGHLAGITGTLEGGDQPGEDTSVSSRPDAMVMFNPALVLPSLEDLKKNGDPKDLTSRFSGDPAAVSPASHVKPGMPPAIIFHGKADNTVAYATAEQFTNLAVKAGNRCELCGYEGQGHGFFNWYRPGKEYFVKTLEKTDEFLASLGWLEGSPRVREFFARELAGSREK
ncbi:Acetylxylan esterase precursor [Caulifigura coniformis]|uniref:Acetylxylan esterase n=1 Tax=Caulifigura coniformis TaxID=2527983 RepID=A0A517SHP9_9PLAN|nr:alpha/beta hydrolase [Caulifigura coniformis]QDT55641.1 Acetylxylan esterase precursor [Caulifigura coniformis]